MAHTKMRRVVDWTAYYPRYPKDFTEGVMLAGMTFEQEGFYSRFLDEQWKAQGPLDDDVKKLAQTMRSDPRTVRRLLDEIIAMGERKITRVAGKLYNPRMQREIDKHVKRMLARQAAQSENPAPQPQHQLPLVTVHEGGRPRPRGPKTLGSALADLGESLKRRGGY